MCTEMGKGKKPEVLLNGMLGAVLILFMASQAHGHRIRVFASAEGNEVSVEAAYRGGEKASGARVEVTDESGASVAQGVIGEEGRFLFAVKAPGEYRVSVTDGKGHRGTFILKREAFHLHQGDAGIEFSPAGPGSSSESGVMAKESNVGGTSGQRELEEVIDRKMEPIRQELREIRRIVDRPLSRDIVGGVGYIVGLVGLVFFLLGRKTGGGK